MKIKYKNSWQALAALALTAGMTMTSCDDKDIIAPNVKNILIDTIQVNVSDVLPIAVDMDSTLSYSFTPANATNPTLLWTSNDESIAKVSQDGTVTGVGVGSTIIKVAPAIGFGSETAVKTITVKVVPEIIKATAIEFSNTETEIYETDKLQLKYSILPEDHTYDYLTWTSSDESVATVSASGLVTAFKAGEVTITAHAQDKSGVTGSFKLTVRPYIAVEDVTIQPLGGPIAVNQTAKLDFTYSPEGATAGSVEWTTSDSKVLTVNQGVITPVGFGSAIVTATCKSNGKQQSVNVTIADGWYIWDANNDFAGWQINTAGATMSKADGKISVTMKNNGGKWRGDIIYKGSPSQFGGGQVIIAVKGVMPSVGSRKWDAVSTAGNSGGPNMTNKLTAKDGSVVYYYDMSSKFAAMSSQLLNFSVFQFKMADFPAATTDQVYTISWIRTFKSVTELQSFIDNE